MKGQLMFTSMWGHKCVQTKQRCRFQLSGTVLVYTYWFAGDEIPER